MPVDLKRTRSTNNLAGNQDDGSKRAKTSTDSVTDRGPDVYEDVKPSVDEIPLYTRDYLLIGDYEPSGPQVEISWSQVSEDEDVKPTIDRVPIPKRTRRGRRGGEKRAMGTFDLRTTDRRLVQVLVADVHNRTQSPWHLQ